MCVCVCLCVYLYMHTHKPELFKSSASVVDTADLHEVTPGVRGADLYVFEACLQAAMRVFKRFGGNQDPSGVQGQRFQLEL